MAPIANFSAYKAAAANPPLQIAIIKTTVTSNSNVWRSTWALNPNAGAAPTTAAAVSSATAGAFGPLPTRTASIYPISGNFDFGVITVAGPFLLLCDRLSHQGGLSGTATGEQTTNLPTAALTRHTSGVGVIAGLEIYTAIGTSGATATVNYTNSDGTSAQTSEPALFGAANSASNATGFTPIMLQSGDVGVRSVQGVTLSGTTGTAGAFGVTLLKPLLLLPASHGGEIGYSFNSLIDNGASMPEIDDGACLQLLFFSASPAAVAMAGVINFGLGS